MGFAVVANRVILEDDLPLMHHEQRHIVDMIRLDRRAALKLALSGVAGAALTPAALARTRAIAPGPRTEVRRHRGRPQ